MKRIGMILLCAMMVLGGLPVADQTEVSATAVESNYTGWKTGKNGNRFFYRDGVKQKGWTRVGNKYRYFTKGIGKLRKNCTIGGRKIDENGVWTPVIVLDPGHSANVASGLEPLGPDLGEMKAKDNSGTQGVATGVEEYELTLTIAKQLKARLEKRGCKVYMTRTNNKKAISCKERAAIANKRKADAYIRIHANGSEISSSMTGAMTICTTRTSSYITKKTAKKNYELSTEILNAYVKATKCREEYVWDTPTMSGNNWSKVPTTIIEMGYMSNPTEDRKMQAASYQKKMVRGICTGIENYLL